MPGRFFLDTNVILYAWSTDPAKAARADELIEMASQARTGVISYQVAQEALNVLMRGPTPLRPAAAREYFDQTLRPLLAVPSSAALILEALWIAERYRTAWCDSLIVAAALAAECDILYSEDFQPGMQFGKLRVVNPFTE